MIRSIAYLFAVLLTHRPGGKGHNQRKHGNRWKKGKSRQSRNIVRRGGRDVRRGG